MQRRVEYSADQGLVLSLTDLKNILADVEGMEGWTASLPIIQIDGVARTGYIKKVIIKGQL